MANNGNNGVAFDLGTYRDFTGYINFNGIEGWVEDSDFDIKPIHKYGRCYSMDWKGGTWAGGTCTAAYWRDGVWKSGTWRDGIWNGGEWLYGDWHGGMFCGGDWLDGTWHDGDLLAGTWHRGKWINGKLGLSVWRKKWLFRTRVTSTWELMSCR